LIDLKTHSGKLAFTTDSFVVSPLFFPGGDIGKLAVCGTVNDLAVVGAKPRYIAASFILEEGLPLEVLNRIVRSIAVTAEEAGVNVATGDTKVVERGACDRLFITTTGIGTVAPETDLTGRRIEIGDRIVVSGFVGDHGTAVLSAREGLDFETDLHSDCAPLNGIVEAVLTAIPGEVKWMRDPTRGGTAATLNELVSKKGFGVTIRQEDIPVREEVKGVCEMLGFDPLHIANEGKVIVVVSEVAAEPALEVLKRTKYGEDAQIIGEIIGEPAGKVLLETGIGGTRIVEMPHGELLPRIC
jgi:hydrogenase expression/formation protein HypE